MGTIPVRDVHSLNSAVQKMNVKTWLFKTQTAPVTWWKTILWWELRRIPVNVLIGAYGILSLSIFYWGILTSGHLQPGEDAVEPLALLIAPFIVNICYTLGWLTEISARAIFSVSPQFGPLLLKLGIILSLFLVSIPALLWGGYRLLQLSHFLS